ncbi:hypothetical protein CH289_23685 [Rhodococcus sp. RS1C4]|uniref:hypothetical protein n=1 Tax=Nocardiaceae TaxID=85025 RepID=UPI00037DD498|nr:MULTISPECIES: hypothetical protein [Rhodococcus]OZC45455.1 hypothetical protein CH289_23685 [Rhodococcus sp. RS1C4]OZC89461.1 hypothetical protein CH282_05805 [Rhodococcus sp. 06-418-1B]OZD05638.1 hypothetical protein CH280_28005 [Rhodococcus sp. 06-156-4C]OZD16753.1 hypothetical protein CH248_20975 [Rhodococcus sp. 06-156-4a]OZD26611.1 hypothetical protein CH253_02495 [Rhodococcus sp. 06-156-3C]
MKLWKVLGLAGVVGVAATGALVVKSERTRRAYAPDEVRAQLHRRFAEAAETEPPPPLPTPTRGQRLRAKFSRAR